MLNAEREAIISLLEEEGKTWQGVDPTPECEGSTMNRSLPEIVVTNRPMRSVSKDSVLALQNMNIPPTIFARSGEMVHIAADESGRLGIKKADPAFLRGRMDRAADYLRVTKDGPLPIAPPKDVVSDVIAQDPSFWKFPPLRTLVTVPILRPDGTVLTSPGYDVASAVYYAPETGIETSRIATAPDRSDVKNALTLLDEAVGEFPFSDKASRANTLALLLTPIVRVAIKGQVPLALIDAPQSGSGKSLLTRVVSQVTAGSDAAMMSAPREEEEWRKSITAILRAGSPIVIYDNITSVLQSASLAMALTAPIWKDRVLGLSETILVPQQSTWIATGNNLRIGGDLPRRCYWIRLDAKMSQPWTRNSFRHPELIPWVTEHRGELLAALLTIARAWFAAGRPKGKAPHIGGFENWTETLGGILSYAGVEGFLANTGELYELADETAPQWEGFLRSLLQRYGSETFTVSALAAEMESHEQMRAGLPEDLAAAWGEKGAASASFKTRLGKAFRNRVDTRYGPEGWHLQRAGKESRGGCISWRVVAGVQGSQGSNLPTCEGNRTVKDDDEMAGTTLPPLQPLLRGEV